MRFTCVKDNLRDAIFLVERVVGKRLTLPILNAVLITAEKGKITFTTTNLETGIETRIHGKVEEEGKVAIPVKVLSSYIASLREDQITLVSNKDTVTITSGGTKTQIKGFSPDEFPLLPKVKKDEVFTLSAEVVRNALSNVSMSAATSEIKPEIASILFKFNSNACHVAATDSFRLAEKRLPYSTTEPHTMNYFLLPLRSAIEIMKLLEIGDENVEISITKGQISFQTRTFLMVSRLTEGMFPEYEKIIPSKFLTEVWVKKDALLDTLKLASLFVGKLHDVTIEVSSDTKTLEITTSNTEVGENSSKIAADIIGEKIKVSFNHRYLLDGVTHLNSEDIFLGFASSSGPLVMKNKGDSSYLYIAMPMKV